MGMRIATLAVMAGLAWLGALPAVAQTPVPTRYSKLTVFGDSLVDAGNAQEGRRRTGGADPTPPALGYADGRFTNGLTFADYLSVDLGLGTTRAALLGGGNFAVGGAKASGTGSPSLSFGEQVASFAGTGQRFGADELVLVTFGGNDLRDELFAFAKTGGADAVDLRPATDALTSGLGLLGALGARNFVVVGLPDIGQIPEVTGNGALPPNGFASAQSRALNDLFRIEAGALAGSNGWNLGFYDLYNQQRTIYADPAGYGLPSALNTSNACLRQFGAAPACTGYVYFDDIHPTTALHSAIAQGIERLGVVAPALVTSAVPEPSTWVAMVLGFGVVGSAMRRRRTAGALATAV